MPHNPSSDVASARRPRLVTRAARIAALGGFLLGYDIGVMSGAILYIRQEYTLTSLSEGIVMSAALWGAAVSAVAAGPVMDRWGRRRTLIAAAMLYLAGALAAAWAPTVALLVTARVAVGAAIGIATLAAPLYISEIATVPDRGRLVAYNQIALACGIVSAYLVAYVLAGTESWRWMLGLAGFPAAVLGMGMLRMPSSPRWLVAHGLVRQAQSALRTLRHTEDVDAELAAIRATLTEQGSWRDLLSPALRPALVVGLGLALFQQATGANAVAYYSPTIVQSAGLLSSSTAILATLGVSLVNLTMTIVAQHLVDRVGRRPLLLASLAGMVLALGVIGVSFALPSHPNVLAIGGLVVYVGSYVLGLAPVFWLLIAEIFPLAVRGKAMGICAALSWATSLIVTLTFLSLMSSLGQAGVFWLYGAIGVVAWVFAWRLVPETRGQSLEQLSRRWPSSPTHHGGEGSSL
ncbi:MAG: sugar porter family MFS transporter [Anaerolineae bacterium]